MFPKLITKRTSLWSLVTLVTALALLACGGRLASSDSFSAAPDAAPGTPDGAPPPTESDAGAPDSSEPPPDSGISLLPYQVVAAAYSRGIDRLVLLTEDNTMHLVDPHTLDDVAVTLPPGNALAVGVSPDGLVAAVASVPQNYVTTFDLQARKPIAQYAVGYRVEQVLVDANYVYVMASTDPGFLTINRSSHAVTPSPITAPYDGDDAVESISSDGTSLLIANEIDLTTLSLGMAAPAVVTSVYDFCDYPDAWFTRDGSMAVTGCAEVRRTADLSLVQPLPQASFVTSLDPFSADGTIAAITTLNGSSEVGIYDPAFNLVRSQSIPTWPTPAPNGPTLGTLIFHDASGNGLFVLLESLQVSESGAEWAISPL